jgi:uncharacterized RDD family membrane protein YckC
MSDRGVTLRRIVAFVLDGLAISFLGFALSRGTDFFYAILHEISTDEARLTHWGDITLWPAILIYFIPTESSRWQASPGKILLRLVLKTDQEVRIGPLRALVRTVVKGLSIYASLATFGVGFPIFVATPFFSRSRKTLHDWAAKTVVVDRSHKESRR